MQIFNLISSKFYLNLLVVFVAFNVIGFLNEYFQNFYQQQPIFNLKETNIKDIIINVIGSSLVVILSLFYKFKN
jgi:VanZ family protein